MRSNHCEMNITVPWAPRRTGACVGTHPHPGKKNQQLFVLLIGDLFLQLRSNYYPHGGIFLYVGFFFFIKGADSLQQIPQAPMNCAIQDTRPDTRYFNQARNP